MTHNIIPSRFILLALAASLAACGGGGADSPALAQAADQHALVSVQEADAVKDDLASLTQPNSWQSFEGDSTTIAHLAASPYLSFSPDARRVPGNRLVVSADFAHKHWHELIQPALDAGRIVVIEAFDRPDGESIIATLTAEHVGIGVIGQAALVSMDADAYQVAGFSANDIDELITAMRTSKRDNV